MRVRPVSYTHLLRSGAEIYRVEESMHRIFEADGVHDGDVFAIPSCIYVTVNTPQGAPLTRVTRILDRQTNLDRVDRANDCLLYTSKRFPFGEYTILSVYYTAKPSFCKSW